MNAADELDRDGIEGWLARYEQKASCCASSPAAGRRRQVDAHRPPAARLRGCLRRPARAPSARTSALRHDREEIDFSLLTDGLQAEREQGITIDVAYRYFTTPIAQVHHRRHAGARAVHAQHGDRRVDLRPRDHPDRRAPRRARRRRGGTRSSARCSASSTSSSPSTRWTSSTTTVVAPLAMTPWYDGPTLLEYLETRAGGGGARPRPDALPGAARAAPPPRLPRLRGPGRVRGAAAGRPGAGAPLDARARAHHRDPDERHRGGEAAHDEADLHRPVPGPAARPAPSSWSTPSTTAPSPPGWSPPRSPCAAGAPRARSAPKSARSGWVTGPRRWPSRVRRCASSARCSSEGSSRVALEPQAALPEVVGRLCSAGLVVLLVDLDDAQRAECLSRAALALDMRATSRGDVAQHILEIVTAEQVDTGAGI
jgi:hypothetical protein